MKAPESCACVGRLAPCTVLGRRSADLQEAARNPRGVDAVGIAEPRDLDDALVEGLGRPDRLRFAEASDEPRQLVPPAGDEPAVPARRAAAADVCLEHDDPGSRRDLGEAQRRPEPGVAAAQYREIRAGVTDEWRRRDVRGQLGSFGGEGLA
jgi:hypothetical protein